MDGVRKVKNYIGEYRYVRKLKNYKDSQVRLNSVARFNVPAFLYLDQQLLSTESPFCSLANSPCCG